MYKFDQSSSVRLKYALGEIFYSHATEVETELEIDQWKLENHYQLLESTEELHAFAAQFNWDGNLNELYWIINHRLCDLATANASRAAGALAHRLRERSTRPMPDGTSTPVSG